MAVPSQGREQVKVLVRLGHVINQARHRRDDGRTIHVAIRVSPSEYRNRAVLLVPPVTLRSAWKPGGRLIRTGKRITRWVKASNAVREHDPPVAFLMAGGLIRMKT